MIIEKVTEQEIDEVKELLSRTWKATYGKQYTPEAVEKITSLWHARDKLLAQAQDKNTYFAAAKIEGKIAGIITVRQNPDRSLFMTRIYVDPHIHGQGIGTRLMESAFTYFPDAPLIRLECEKQNNKACAFYLKNGFRQKAEIQEVVEGVKMTTVEYEKNLSS